MTRRGWLPAILRVGPARHRSRRPAGALIVGAAMAALVAGCAADSADATASSLARTPSAWHTAATSGSSPGPSLGTTAYSLHALAEAGIVPSTDSGSNEVSTSDWSELTSTLAALSEWVTPRRFGLLVIMPDGAVRGVTADEPSQLAEGRDAEAYLLGDAGLALTDEMAFDIGAIDPTALSERRAEALATRPGAAVWILIACPSSDAEPTATLVVTDDGEVAVDTYTLRGDPVSP